MSGDEMLGIYELGLVIGEALDLFQRFSLTDGDELGGWMAYSSKLKARLGLVR